MKVVFKLTADQLIIAKKIAAEVAAVATAEPEPEEFWCGNLLGWNGHSFSFNPNQKLNLEGILVVYEGERSPLVQDCGLLALYRIAAGGLVPEFPGRSDQYHLRKEWYEAQLNAVKTLRVISYETSDRGLQWWQTKADWAHQASLGEIRQGLKKLLANGSQTRWKKTSWVDVAVARLGKELTGVEVGTPAYKKVCAEGRVADWRLVSSLEKLGYF